MNRFNILESKIDDIVSNYFFLSNKPYLFGYDNYDYDVSNFYKLSTIVEKTNREEKVVVVDIEIDGVADLFLSISNYNNPSCVYTTRELHVNKKIRVIIPMPITPIYIAINTYIYKNAKLNPYSIPKNKIKIYFLNGVKKIDTLQPSGFDDYYKLISKFGQLKEVLPLGEYSSNQGKFKIKYIDYVLREDGVTISYSPAAIYKSSGIIEIGKKRVLMLTLYEFIAVMLHEYSHVYVNELYGYKKEDEIQADLNALKLMFSLGFRGFDFITAFLKVFDMANNERNENRYLTFKKVATNIDEKLRKHYEKRIEKELKI